jgi:site-specific DNA recombinase
LELNCRNTSIRSVLTSSIYIGKIEYKGEIYEGKHAAIIDEDTFLRAQKRYDEVKWSNKDYRPFQSKSLLGGVLYCGNCGAMYTGSILNK